ncbi:MAG: DUF2845 domain-containing protein [Anaeromyxobacter sp.]
MRTALLLALAAGLWSAAPVARAESSISCSGGIVQVGDGKLDLLTKCGLPALQDTRHMELSQPHVEEAIEEWTYDFGRSKFTMSVVLQRGRVVSIARGSYGYADSPGQRPFAPRRATCDAAAIRVGDRKLDLISRCGEPAVRDAWQEERAVSRIDLDGGTAYSAGSVQVERWVFDFGGRSFVAEALLENGQVVAVQRGGYGHAQ